MTEAHRKTPSADPAPDEPSSVRPERCGGGRREADPTDENLRMLRHAAHLSMKMMELAVERARRALANDDAPDDEAADRSDLAFQRSGRSLRLCIALSDRLHANRLDRDKKIAAIRTTEKHERNSRLMDQVERVVEQAIKRDSERERERLIESEGEAEDDELPEDDQEEDRLEALTGRLADPDILRDVGECPQSEIIGRICREFGFEPDWALWKDHDWARDEARRNVPGSPYAAPVAKPIEADLVDHTKRPPKPPSG